MFDALMRIFQSVRPRRTPQLPPKPDPMPGRGGAALRGEPPVQDDLSGGGKRALIKSLLPRRFDLTADEFVQLMAAAEEQNKQMVQLHGHTSDISDSME